MSNAASKELKEKLKQCDKTSIPFTLPVLERIKLECLSFLADEFIPSRNGKEVKVGEMTYPLGVVNSHHHVSIGRALFRLIKSNPAFGQIMDEKHLSVRVVGEKVAELTRFYKDQAFLKAKDAGFGFESLNFHRIPDASVDVNVLVEALAFIKGDPSVDKIEIYSQDESTKALRVALNEAEKAEAAKKKAETDAANAARLAAVKGKTVVPTEPEPVKPKRDDEKYSSLFGDDEFAADMADYDKKLAAWKAKFGGAEVAADVANSDDDTDVDMEADDGQETVESED